MSLRIVYGVSGTGKSSYIFNEIAEKIKETRVYVITPEQFSFTAEEKLLSAVGKNAVVNAEVLTFNRMAYRVINSEGGRTKTNLSSSGKAMLVYNTLDAEKKKLNFIGKNDQNIDTVLTQITEFKKHNITPEIMENNINNIEDTYLKMKLEDMYKIYEQYNKTIKNNYIDENDILTILANKIDETKEFNNSEIYIDEFVGFTTQEYEIIRKLLHICKRVTITACTDNIVQEKEADLDIFCNNKITLDKIYNIAKEENIEIENPVKLSERYRFKNNELTHLEKNIYAAFYKKYEKETKNIKLFLANNPYSEIEQVAKTITKLVKNYEYKYKDIAVITKNIDTYASLCKAIFNKYSIPVFIDTKQDLNKNILVKYIISVLDIFAKNWSYEAVFSYLKTGLVKIDKDVLYDLENYCLRWNIKGSKWYNGEWNFYSETPEQIEKINYARNKIIEPLLELRNSLMKVKTIRNITESLYNFLIKQEVDKILIEKINQFQDEEKPEFAKQYETSWQIIMNVFDEITMILGDEIVSFEKYTNILKVGLKNSGLGAIPGTKDQVIFGDVDRSRSHKVKSVFIIGLNDGVFPGSYKQEGFFNDKDREKLKSEGIELAKGTEEKLYDDNFNIYKAFTTAEENLYLSYASSDIDGKSMRASILINRIKKIFKINEDSDIIERKSEILLKETTFEELLTNLQEYREGKNIDNVWFNVFNYYMKNDRVRLENSLKSLNYTNIPVKIKKEEIEKLYGDVLTTSISQLEKYSACPFSYYLQYGLRLTDKETSKIQPVDTGTFMHEVIDEFFDKLEEKNISVKCIETEEIDNIIDEIIDEKLKLKKNYIFNMMKKYVVLIKRLRKAIKLSMRYIVNSLKYSDFEVLGHEIEFKTGKQYEPIEILLEDGKKVQITGKIDRVDIAKTTDGNYIRIIDYKSSIKNIDLNEVEAGLQLQLLTYVDAMCEKESTKPAGALYFSLIEPIIKSSKRLTEEQIEEEIKKQFKMNGLLLADVNIVKKMDKNLESGNSQIVPAYINKEGNLSDKPNLVNREQFERLQKYTVKLLKQISESILTGNINIKPYYSIKKKTTPCEYCSYKSICNFDSKMANNEYNYIQNKEKPDILEEIKNRL
jgi:ATP-dependent helicase/nuclease subunit B